MPLQFLDFDLSEDTSGLRTWDALASPGAVHSAALLQETEALLQHLVQELGPAGPVDEGHRWDMDLQIQDATGQSLDLTASTPATGRITLALSLSGQAELARCLSHWIAL
ncbi:MAG: hypothetical protein ACKOWC_10385 [Limnohabitans sp.]